TPEPERFTDPSLQTPPDFDAMIRPFSIRVYDLLDCRRVSKTVGHLEFDPHRWIFSQTDCMRILVEAFGHRVIRVGARRVTEADWHGSDDVGVMLHHLWVRYGPRPIRDGPGVADEMSTAAALPNAPPELSRALHRFYLACCRRIWKLLPQEESRDAVELAEG